VPSPALLNLCPYKATAGKMACLTRTESTFKNTVVTRNPDIVVELRKDDPTSIAEMKNLMSRVILQGGVNDFTNQLGAGFYNELMSKLSLNNRYRKAYVVNPIMDWSFEAMNLAQTGATGYTVSSKIIAIGLITLRTPDGTQLARRLLSSDMNVELDAAAMLPRMYADKMIRKRALVLEPRFETSDEPEVTAAQGRRLLQASSDLQPSVTQTSNSLILNVNVPGYDATTQLCSIVLGAPYSRCNILQLQTQIKGNNAVNVCKSNAAGTLGATLQSGLHSIMTNRMSQIEGVALLEYVADGCDKVLTGAGSRRLLTSTTTTQEYTILTQHVMVSSVNSTAVFNTWQLQYLAEFFNTSTWTNILGGGGYISTVSMNFQDNSGGNFVANINVGVRNLTNNKEQAVAIINNTIHDIMFIREPVYYSSSSSISSISTS
jgi:hypothetical protein